MQPRCIEQGQRHLRGLARAGWGFQHQARMRGKGIADRRQQRRDGEVGGIHAAQGSSGVSRLRRRSGRDAYAKDAKEKQKARKEERSLFGEDRAILRVNTQSGLALRALLLFLCVLCVGFALYVLLSL
jgi:hypothetical protein